MQDLSATGDLPMHGQTKMTTVPVGQICPLEDQQSQIRLVRFDRNPQNGTFANAISLETHNLVEAPPYAALSYTWGSEISQQPLRVNGKYVSVFENSLCAIKQAFDEGSFVHIWIDSICIDQTSHEEKSVQVQLMSTIYRKAVHVLVSLGPDSNRFNFTGRQIAGLERHVDWAAWDDDAPPAWADNEIRSASCRRAMIMQDWWRHSFEKHSSDRLRKELRQIRLLPYWTRIWIVQEIALAGVVRLMLGDCVIHWRSLAEFYDFISYTSPRRISAPPTLEHASNLSQRMISTEQSLLRVLQTFSRNQCSDPRDRVYGLLSLISWPKLQEQIKPDYDKSVLAVAADTLKYAAETEKVLSLMRCEESAKDMDWQVSSRRAPSEESQSSQIPTNEETYYGYVNVHPMLCHWLLHGTRGQLYLPFHPVRIDGEVVDRKSPSPQFSKHQPIYSTSDSSTMVGHICHEARPGDLVAWNIYHLGWNVATSVALVLRRTAHTNTSNQTLYQIIGQCLPEPGYAPCTLQEDCGCDEKQTSQVVSYAELPIELHLDPIDAIVYVGQDILGTANRSERPGTRICSTPWSSFATVG